MKERLLAIILVGLFFLLTIRNTQSEPVTFLEGGFSWPAETVPPNATTGSDGRQYRPLIQGYPISDWDDDRTVIQILQANVENGSVLEQQVNTFMGDDEEETNDVVNSVGVEVN
ncbi:uncharacterized protein [Palaemon carinicauda]|uniref:uncharacterized protein n=1 Tax=Palaemon carinicauda TaxID=392227 RepID=UPI0035B63CD5